ncbi:MAG: hypothetical protein ACREJ2_13960 [Planctomycetota bacterium]
MSLLATSARAAGLSPRERVLQVLHGGRADKVPFTLYDNKIYSCTAERLLRNRGLCIVPRRAPFKTHRPNVKTTQSIRWEGDRQWVTTHHETPVGVLTSLHEPVGFTNWVHEKLFKTPEDYRALEFFIRDERYEEDYAAFAQAQRDFGEDGLIRATIGLEPLQQLQSGGFMDMQQFCLEWMDHRDEVLKLYAALVAGRRQIYPLVAASPATHANYGGNVTPEVVSNKMFEQYYLPHYHEAAEALHRGGKRIGCHFDANCKRLAKLIGQADLDYIEAFTPAPDTDMTLGEARAAWPNRVLWINFPSSVHLRPDSEVAATAVELLEQLDRLDGILFAVTEDMPPERWQGSCTAIMDGLERHAREHPDRYAP